VAAKRLPTGRGQIDVTVERADPSGVQGHDAVKDKQMDAKHLTLAGNKQVQRGTTSRTVNIAPSEYDGRASRRLRARDIKALNNDIRN